jgi:hypothetical protein
MATYSFKWAHAGSSGSYKVEADSDEAAYRRIKEYLGTGSFRKQLVSGSIVMTETHDVDDPPWAKDDHLGRMVSAAKRIYG